MKTMLARAGVTTLAALGLAFAGSAAQAQTVFTAWNFDNYTPPATGTGKGTIVTGSPTSSTGTGTATSLGMTNTYGTPGPSRDASNILNTSASEDGTSATGDQGSSDLNQNSATSNIWRIVGTKSGTTAANGWSSSAPVDTQGAQFSTSTVGFTNISVSYDWLPTKQGVANQDLQYTTDGSTWITAKTIAVTPIATTGNSVWNNAISYNFSSITAANEDPNFAIRMVSTTDPNSADATFGQYINTTGTALNNSSGNWRFDEVQFSCTADSSPSSAPEPSQLAGLTFFFLGASALAFRARKRANTAA